MVHDQTRLERKQDLELSRRLARRRKEATEKDG